MKKVVLVMQHDETDCAAACLASVAKYYGKSVSINKIRFYAGTDCMGTSGLGIVKGAEALGLDCRGMLSQTKEFSDEIVFPIICHIKKDVLDHYVVVYGVKKNKVVVADPSDGIKKIRMDEFMASWSGVFFVVYPKQSFKCTRETKGIFQRFFYLLKPYKKTVVECFIAGIILSVLGAASAFYFRFLIDDVLYSQMENTLTLCSLAYFLVIVFQIVTDFARNQLMNYMSNKIDLLLMCDYFKHILHLPLSFFTSRKTGEIISRIGDTQTIRHMISSTTLSVVIDSCMLLLGGILLFLFGSQLLFVAMIPVIVSTVIVWVFVKPFREKLKEQAFREAEKQSSLVECVNGIATVKALSSEESAFVRTEAKLVDCIKRSISLGTMSNIENALQGFVSAVGNLLLYWIGSLMIFKGSLSLGQLISFVTLSGYFLGPLSRLLTLQQALQEAAIASDRLSEIMDMPEEMESEDQLIELERVSGKIEVRNLSFSYGSRGTALRNVSFKIFPGQKVAFVGTSGSGKTTMTKLLMKFYRPEKGSIFVDGKNICDFDTESYRRCIGYVPQEVLLFSGTILENILWGSQGKTIQDAAKAAEEAEASEFISRLPDRLNTVVGERGATLSGGERQRVSLARILLRKPSLMILDEATASLDVLSEKSIMRTIKNTGKGATMIIVAHRLSTIKDCDNIFVFDKGSLVESGSHEALLSKKGKYYEMWKVQNEENSYISGKNAG